MKKIVNKSNKLTIRQFKFKDVYNSNYFKWLSDKEVTKYILRNELGKNFDKAIIVEYLKKISSSKKDIFFFSF